MKNSIFTLAFAITFLVAANVRADLIRVENLEEYYDGVAVAFTFTATLVGNGAGQGSYDLILEGYNGVVSHIDQTDETSNSSTFLAIAVPENGSSLIGFGFTGQHSSSGKPVSTDDLMYALTHPGSQGGIHVVNAENYDGHFYHMGETPNMPEEVTDLSGGTGSFIAGLEGIFGWDSALTLYLDTLVLEATPGAFNNANTVWTFTFYTGERKGTDAATPEPATLAIIGLGLAGLGVARARRRK